MQPKAKATHHVTCGLASVKAPRLLVSMALRPLLNVNCNHTQIDCQEGRVQLASRCSTVQCHLCQYQQWPAGSP
jgi:hypothetical protein